MSSFEEVVKLANVVSKEYFLCDNCLGRLFSNRLHLSSNKRLGKKLQKNKIKNNLRCYICKNFFSNIDNFLNLMINNSSKYSFSTFGVGAIIQPSIVDRDDYIRSRFKLKRIDSVKTDIIKELAKLFSKKTGKTLEPQDPDLTFTIHLKDNECFVRSKSLVLSGRYVKLIRDVPQKQRSCWNCSGKGCGECSYHGISKYDSVEGLISKFLFNTLGGTTAKFNWIGGEDKSSLVLGNGRPFFVKIQNPNKRKILQRTADLESVKVTGLKIIDKSPTRPLSFHSLLKIKIRTEKIDSSSLRNLKSLKLQPVIVYEKSGKRLTKNISSLKYLKKSNNEFILLIQADGGLPVKRFVVGDEIRPSVSSILNTACHCERFDILGVEIQ